MSEDSRQRLAAFGGIGFVILAVVGAFLPTQPPAFDAGVSKIRQYFVDHQTALDVSNLLTAAAVVLVFAFIGGLRIRIAREEGEGGYLASVFFGAALVTIAMALVGIFLTAAMTQRIAGLADDNLVRAGFEITYLVVFGGAAFTTAVLLVAGSSAILRTSMFAPWVGWLGMVGAVVNLVGGGAIMVQATSGLAVLALIGFLLLAIWIAALSVVILVRLGASGRARAGTAPPA